MFFDCLFRAADCALDGVFAGPATYRAGGTSIGLAYASVRSLGVGNDQEKTSPASRLRYVVELHASDLVVSSQPWLPRGGDEIVFANADGTLAVYMVGQDRSGRSYEPLDTEGRKLLVFANFIRTESGT